MYSTAPAPRDCRRMCKCPWGGCGSRHYPHRGSAWGIPLEVEESEVVLGLEAAKGMPPLRKAEPLLGQRAQALVLERLEGSHTQLLDDGVRLPGIAAHEVREGHAGCEAQGTGRGEPLELEQVPDVPLVGAEPVALTRLSHVGGPGLKLFHRVFLLSVSWPTESEPYMICRRLSRHVTKDSAAAEGRLGCSVAPQGSEQSRVYPHRGQMILHRAS